MWESVVWGSVVWESVGEGACVHARSCVPYLLLSRRCASTLRQPKANPQERSGTARAQGRAKAELGSWHLRREIVKPARGFR